MYHALEGSLKKKWKKRKESRNGFSTTYKYIQPNYLKMYVSLDRQRTTVVCIKNTKEGESSNKCR